MIPLSQNETKYEDLSNLFLNFISEVNYFIKDIQKSITHIIMDVKFSPIDAIIEDDVPSLLGHSRKTLDNLKTATCMLRGYAKSKIKQSEQQSLKKSKIQHLSLSRNRQSRVSMQSRIHSQAIYSKNDPSQNLDVKRKDIGLAIFESPLSGQAPGNSPKNEAAIPNLVNYRSLRSFSKSTQVNNIEKITQAQVEHNHQNNNQFDGSFSYKSSENFRKRASTLDKLGSSRIEEVINDAQLRFKQCLVKHESRMDEIIGQNGECIKLLDVIRKNIKRKKQKNHKQAPQVKEKSRRITPRYQSMTVSPQLQVGKA